MTTSAQPDWRTGRIVATAPVARDVQRITVQRPARGRAAPGSHLDVRVPMGDRTDVRSYSIVADYTLVYVGRSRERMAYLHELAALHGDRLQVHVDAEQTPLDVAELVGSIGCHPLGAATELYMCGPIRLMDAVRREWEAACLPPVNLRFETFGSSGWFQPEEFVVSVPQRRIQATVRSDETILEALTRAGVDLMYDCRKGECGLCLLEVEQVDGTLDHRDVFLSAAQKADGRSISTCVSRVVAREDSPNGPRVSLALP